MPNPHNLIKRAQKLERQEALRTLLEAIETHPLSPSEQQQFLGRIVTAINTGSITPQEANALTKASEQRRRVR